MDNERKDSGVRPTKNSHETLNSFKWGTVHKTFLKGVQNENKNEYHKTKINL